MVEQALIELLKGIGRFFLHPLTYYLVFFAVVIGWLRVKRERRDFHIRVLDLFTELQELVPRGLLIGFILSLVTLTLGMVIPLGAIVVMAAITILCSFTFKPRWLSPAYIVGLSLLAIIFLQGSSIELAIVKDLNTTNLSSIAILLGLLMIAEGILIFNSKNKKTSPIRIKSRRGFTVGAHKANRLWLLPVFFLIPGNVIQAPFEWWPLLSIHGETYSLLLVPFSVGFTLITRGKLPDQAIRKTSIHTIWLGIIITMMAAASIWVPILTILAAGMAIIGREAITFYQRVQDDRLPFYYSRREQGLVILGIIPKSPAEKMALKIGEVIVKVNGIPVQNTVEFYQALHKNRAYCKLEVLDTNGEIRFAQRALYDGEHHELGIIFIQDEKKWENEAI